MAHSVSLYELVGNYPRIVASSSKEHKKLRVVVYIEKNGVTTTHYIVEKNKDIQYKGPDILTAIDEYNKIQGE